MNKALVIPIILMCLVVSGQSFSQIGTIHYEISMPRAASHYYHIDLTLANWKKDTLILKMPQWMPGYYQIMSYGKSVEDFKITSANNKSALVRQLDDHTWQLSGAGGGAIGLSYDVKADKNFVANSYVDSEYGYMVTAALFPYVDGFLNTPVSIKVVRPAKNTRIATGLEPVSGTSDEFKAPDFDILYDCPILVGNLEELPSFKVQGIEHRFIGVQPGAFDRALFMNNLKKVVEAAVAVIGEIPYRDYTFIAIGPGRGGIEHLNNTTFSFDGNTLNTLDGMNRMLNFLAHEYFHHYNVKRIRPYELGPFDYDQGSRTNLLWVSEGISVYYEYLIVKRAGLQDAQTLFSNFEKDINAVENNPGRAFQSLSQASYATWSEGPFGTQGNEAGKTISYYDKGPVFGLFLDLAIRQATENKKSLDDVMRFLYWQYYKKLGRGFTDAEFQQACETTAGRSLNELFEYVYTTREFDYQKYLGYAGLKMEMTTELKKGKPVNKFSIKKLPTADALQSTMLRSWLGEK